MTKNSALKRDARAYQREHPGTRLADAMRAVPRSTATDGAGPTGGRAKPWIQRTDVETGCYFCGRDSVILSYTDLHDDHGRVEIYCDNGDCDAREIEVIIIEDGTSTTRNRTDVRILNHFGPDGDRPGSIGIGPGSDWAAGTTPHLRRSESTATCLFCGERTCVISAHDLYSDTGRLGIECTNPICTVHRAEALLVRDGMLWASDRPVAKALRGLFPTRADQKAESLPPGEPPIFPFSDFATPADGIDPLQMRISGPVPWENDS